MITNRKNMSILLFAAGRKKRQRKPSQSPVLITASLQLVRERVDYIIYNEQSLSLNKGTEKRHKGKLLLKPYNRR